jgi:Tfp pilus assembly protein PilF
LALAADPNNVDAHDYLAQAYGEDGQADLAKSELARIAAIRHRESQGQRGTLC